MPIERLAHLVCAVVLVLTLLTGAAMAVPEAWDKAAHFTAFSVLTLCLWRATRAPLLAMCAALLFGGLDEWRQAFVPGRLSDAKDFLADVCGVLATGALLFMQTKRTCAESSPR